MHVLINDFFCYTDNRFKYADNDNDDDIGVNDYDSGDNGNGNGDTDKEEKVYNNNDNVEFVSQCIRNIYQFCRNAEI